MKTQRKLLTLVFLLTKGALAAETNSADTEIPPLRPARGIIGPSYWELHSSQLTLAAILLLMICTILVWWLARSRPRAEVPPRVQAQKQLETLRREPENGQQLSKVSQVLRHYVGAVFGLPPIEMTTTDFCRCLSGQKAVGASLSAALEDFLRQCDRRKFSGIKNEAPLGAVDVALTLVERCETRKRELEETVEPTPALPTGSAPNPRGGSSA